jgi:hypothetical protein
MAADFFTPGAVEFYIQPQASLPANIWYYLGTAVTAPEIESQSIYFPITSDLNAPAPYQKAFCSEQHRIIVTLNRLNHETWNLLKSDNTLQSDVVRRFKTGRLVLNADDYLLFMRYQLPNENNPLITFPSSSPKGRIYFSVLMMSYAESTVNNRVQEVTLLFECNPLYNKREKYFYLYSEKNSDLPNGLFTD